MGVLRLDRGRWRRQIPVALLWLVVVAPSWVGAQPASEPVTTQHRDPVSAAEAERVIGQLRTLRAELARDMTGDGVVLEQGHRSTATKDHAATTDTDQEISFWFDGQVERTMTTSRKADAGLTGAVLRVGPQEFRLQRTTAHLQQGGMQRLYSVVRGPARVIAIEGLPRRQITTWTMGELTKIPDGRSDAALFRDALGSAGKVYLEGNLVSIVVDGPDGSRIISFDLVLDGVPTFYARVSRDRDVVWKNELVWKSQDGKPVPVTITCESVQQNELQKIWITCKYTYEFRRFRVGPVDPSNFAVRALDIPPGTIFSDLLPQRRDFPYGEANLLKSSGIDAAKSFVATESDGRK